jgi:hypothetical protein
MRRDMDFIREFLLSIENGQNEVHTLSKEVAANKGYRDGRGLENEVAQKLLGHIKILEQANLIEVKDVPPYGEKKIIDLTWQGHDLIEPIRDPETWRKTKDGALKAGGWTVELLKEIAKGLIKRKFEDASGIKL